LKRLFVRSGVLKAWRNSATLLKRPLDSLVGGQSMARTGLSSYFLLLCPRPLAGPLSSLAGTFLRLFVGYVPREHH
jgi:hypothetical protein